MPRCFAPRRLVVIPRISALICLALLLSACSPALSILGQNHPAPSPTPFALPTSLPALPLPASFQESPQLAGQVKADLLPAVKERLPEHPKVVRPVESQGKYGGTWRMTIQPVADTAQFIRTVAYEPLVRWTSDGLGIEPNLAETYTVNSDATEYTFTLRRGVRWSDGQPFTTGDIRFWYNDVLLNKELTPAVPAWLKGSGEVAKFEFVDDLTFKVRFQAPNSLFLQELAAPDALAITAFPEHYARGYNLNYVKPDVMSQMVKDGGYTSWADMFVRRVGVNPQDLGNYIDPKRPRLSAWVMTSVYRPLSTSVTWQRNPYYWKVDPAGRQLPYIDRVVFTIVNSSDDVVNQAINNNLDMQDLSGLGIDVATILPGRDSSPYKLVRLQDSSNNVMVIDLNLTNPDPVKRSVFQNRDFRIALSYAINRQEILDLLYNEKGKPWQAAPGEDSPFYDEVLATQFTEYSPQKASEYLDKAGLPKDALGHRLGEDGLPVSFSVEVLETKPQQIAMLNLVSKYLSDVGINLQPRIDSLPIFMAMVRSNQHDAVAWEGGGVSFYDVLLAPGDYVPVTAGSYWAVSWVNWYNRVSSNSTPPDMAVLQAIGYYDQVRKAVSPGEQVRLMKQTLLASQQGFWTIGIAQGPEQYGIIRKNFHNVPAQMPASWIYPDPAPTNPEQYYVDQ